MICVLFSIYDVYHYSMILINYCLYKHIHPLEASLTTGASVSVPFASTPKPSTREAHVEEPVGFTMPCSR